jgi:outer membrane protein OmpA-like peptidoglycan-associated protein
LETGLLAPPRRAHIWLSLLSATLLVGGVALWSRGQVRDEQEASQRTKTLDVLAAEPGIVVTGVEWTRGHHRVTGLLDPLAARPEALIEAQGLPPVDTAFGPFLSLDPRMLERRNAIEVEKAAEELRYAAAALDDIAVPFDVDQTKIDPAEQPVVFHAATEAENALQLAALEHVRACIEVDGHADASGEYARNQRLSGARARELRHQLEAMGVEPEALLARGAGVAHRDSNLRNATVHLLYGDAARGCGVTL